MVLLGVSDLESEVSHGSPRIVMKMVGILYIQICKVRLIMAVLGLL